MSRLKRAAKGTEGHREAAAPFPADDRRLERVGVSTPEAAPAYRGSSVIQAQLLLSEDERLRSQETLRKRDSPGIVRPLMGVCAGSFLSAFAYVYFQGPSHLAIGGAAGLSIVLSSLIPSLTQDVALWIVNAAIIVVGLVLVDRRVVFWSVVGSLAVPAFSSALTLIWPANGSLSGDLWVDLVCTVMLCSTGAAIAFNAGASTGGTDILALALSAHSTLPVGKALTVANAITACSSFPLYGTYTGIHCVVGLVLSGTVVESILSDLKRHKVCVVICHYPARVEEFIVRHLRRTATVSQAYGAYSGKRVVVIMTVLARAEAAKLERFIREVDSEAFVTYLNTSQITGRGFRLV